jgi:putative glutamine amidotransferase
MRPLIAVAGRRATTSSCLRYTGTVAAEAVCDAVLRAGGEPVILHGGTRADIAATQERMARFNGLVLPGGGDLNPARYCQAAAAQTEQPDDLQDEFDMAVIRAALGIALPTLAICRGMQVLNVASGGTLRQHLEGGPVEHRGGRHDVTIAAGSRLRAVAGADTIDVSSYHHQAVDRVGAGLRIVGCAPDGCVEAVENSSSSILAVQWHPEDLAASHGNDQALFDDLVKRSRTGAALAVC